MSTRLHQRLVLLLCAAALAATACGGSGESAADDAVAASSDESDQAISAQEETYESPIGDLLGIPIGNDDAAEQYFQDLSRQAERSIAECMLAQGFEYQVVDYSAIESLGAGFDFDSRQFAEEYGFGIVTSPFEESFEAFEAFVDPNQEYVESLSEGEQEAYQAALNGDFSGLDPDDDQAFQPGGCQGQAFEEVFAFGEVFDQFGDEFEEIEQAFEADERIVSAGSGWSTCMSEAGYSYDTQESAEADIRRRHNDLGGNLSGFVLPPEIEDEAEASEAFGFEPPDPETQAQLDDLAVEERAIAVASWDCDESRRAIEDEVRIEYEQRFVDEHGDAIRAALDN